MFIMYFFGHPLTYPTLAVALILVGAGTASFPIIILLSPHQLTLFLVFILLV